MLTILKEFRERIRYLIDRAFAREFVGQIILFALLFVVVILFGMTAIFFGLLAEKNADVAGIPGGGERGLGDALWWALGYVVRIDNLADMYGASGPIVVYAAIMSLMGLAVFGVLVSIINNAMRSRIELLQQGDTPVKERGHVLILGWNNRIFSVLRQLARLKPHTRVVILNDQDLKSMSEALRLAGTDKLNLTIILRRGVPSNQDELSRVAVEWASAIIALADEFDGSGVIKTLVLLANLEQWPGQKPTMTAEVAMEQDLELAEIGARGRIHVVSGSRVNSKVIVQTIRNQGLSRVYEELMSLRGNGIFVKSMPQCNGKTFREISFSLPGAIPIGITWLEQGNRHKAGLNPEPDYDVSDDEQLVLLARRPAIKYLDRKSEYESSIFRERKPAASVPIRALLIGWSDVLYDILRELSAHSCAGSEVVIVTTLDPTGVNERLPDNALNQLKHLQVSYAHVDPIQGNAFDGIDLTAFDSIVVLSHVTDESEEPDSRALRIMLRLCRQPGFATFRQRFVVELQDRANRKLFSSLGVGDVVVSSDVISAQIAQISQQPVLGSIYRELLSAGGVEIALRPVGDYVQPGSECRFHDLVFSAQQNSEIALGLYLDSQQVLLNPLRETAWNLGDNDQVILLAQQVYH